MRLLLVITHWSHGKTTLTTPGSHVNHPARTYSTARARWIDRRDELLAEFPDMEVRVERRGVQDDGGIAHIVRYTELARWSSRPRPRSPA